MLVRRLAFAAVYCIAVTSATPLPARQYAIGADVSFLASSERNGVVFMDNGRPKDVLTMLRDHHCNWVRLRLFAAPGSSVGTIRVS